MADSKISEYDWKSVPAILAFVLLAEFGAFGLALFLLIMLHVPIQAEMLGILGTYAAALFGAVNLGLGFWLGASSGSKTANAALAQLAGAGPPPPAAPLGKDPPA